MNPKIDRALAATIVDGLRAIQDEMAELQQILDRGEIRLAAITVRDLRRANSSVILMVERETIRKTRWWRRRQNGR